LIKYLIKKYIFWHTFGLIKEKVNWFKKLIYTNYSKANKVSFKTTQKMIVNYLLDY